MLRKFFDVYAIYDNKSGEYFSVDGFTKDVNKIANLVLFFPILWLIVKLMNWEYRGERKLRIKKMWMPTVKIDATIYPHVLKKIFEESENKNGQE